MGRTIQDKVTAPHIRGRKATAGRGDRIAALTAYDHPTAQALDRAGIDILLVGDSAGMVVHGYDSTLPVTMEMMLVHTAAVSRARPRALVVADMPFLSYHAGIDDAVRHAGRFLKEAGAEGVKVEGGRRRAAVVRAIVEAEIPVMGHLGLTPQSVNAMGGYRVQGRSHQQVKDLVEDARALEESGAFCIVLEGMPGPVARLVTSSVAIPTLGIGAGAECDGQILVTHDLLGLADATPPRFVRRYADLRPIITDAAARYLADVRSGDFPSEKETYPCPPELAAGLEPRRLRPASRKR